MHQILLIYHVAFIKQAYSSFSINFSVSLQVSQLYSNIEMHAALNKRFLKLSETLAGEIRKMAVNKCEYSQIFVVSKKELPPDRSSKLVR